MDWNSIKVGDRFTETYEWAWQEYAFCGEPATYKCTFLLPNARANPESKGYGGDDISWCSDYEEFACEEHKNAIWKDHNGYEVCSRYPLDKFRHMGFIRNRVETDD